MDYTVRTIHEYSYTKQANKILINTHVRVTLFLPFSNVYTIKSIREEENKKMEGEGEPLQTNMETRH